MAVRTTIRVLPHMANSSRIFLLPGDRGCVILAPEVGQACARHRDDTWCASSSSRAPCCSAWRPCGAPCAAWTWPPPSGRRSRRSPWGPRAGWDSLETDLWPSLGVREVLVLALCSAISEEVLFRGVLQREVGIVAASAIFGLLHPLGIAYVLWAATAGAGLGGLFALTGSLAAPVAAHGMYNLLALVYLRRRSNPPEERL